MYDAIMGANRDSREVPRLTHANKDRRKILMATRTYHLEGNICVKMVSQD